MRASELILRELAELERQGQQHQEQQHPQNNASITSNNAQLQSRLNASTGNVSFGDFSFTNGETMISLISGASVSHHQQQQQQQQTNVSNHNTNNTASSIHQLPPNYNVAAAASHLAKWNVNFEIRRMLGQSVTKELAKKEVGTVAIPLLGEGEDAVGRPGEKFFQSKSPLNNSSQLPTSGGRKRNKSHKGVSIFDDDNNFLINNNNNMSRTETPMAVLNSFGISQNNNNNFTKYTPPVDEALPVNNNNFLLPQGLSSANRSTSTTTSPTLSPQLQQQAQIKKIYHQHQYHQQQQPNQAKYLQNRFVELTLPAEDAAVVSSTLSILRLRRQKQQQEDDALNLAKAEQERELASAKRNRKFYKRLVALQEKSNQEQQLQKERRDSSAAALVPSAVVVISPDVSPVRRNHRNTDDDDDANAAKKLENDHETENEVEEAEEGEEIENDQQIAEGDENNTELFDEEGNPKKQPTPKISRAARRKIEAENAAGPAPGSYEALVLASARSQQKRHQMKKMKKLLLKNDTKSTATTMVITPSMAGTTTRFREWYDEMKLQGSWLPDREADKRREKEIEAEQATIRAKEEKFDADRQMTRNRVLVEAFGQIPRVVSKVKRLVARDDPPLSEYRPMLCGPDVWLKFLLPVESSSSSSLLVIDPSVRNDQNSKMESLLDDLISFDSPSLPCLDNLSRTRQHPQGIHNNVHPTSLMEFVSWDPATSEKNRRDMWNECLRYHEAALDAEKYNRPIEEEEARVSKIETLAMAAERHDPVPLIPKEVQEELMLKRRFRKLMGKLEVKSGSDDDDDDEYFYGGENFLTNAGRRKKNRKRFDHLDDDTFSETSFDDDADSFNSDDINDNHNNNNDGVNKLSQKNEGNDDGKSLNFISLSQVAVGSAGSSSFRRLQQQQNLTFQDFADKKENPNRGKKEMTAEELDAKRIRREQRRKQQIKAKTRALLAEMSTDDDDDEDEDECQDELLFGQKNPFLDSSRSPASFRRSKKQQGATVNNNNSEDGDAGQRKSGKNDHVPPSKTKEAILIRKQQRWLKKTLQVARSEIEQAEAVDAYVQYQHQQQQQSHNQNVNLNNQANFLIATPAPTSFAGGGGGNYCLESPLPMTELLAQHQTQNNNNLDIHNDNNNNAQEELENNRQEMCPNSTEPHHNQNQNAINGATPAAVSSINNINSFNRSRVSFRDDIFYQRDDNNIDNNTSDANNINHLSPRVSQQREFSATATAFPNATNNNNPKSVDVRATNTTRTSSASPHASEDGRGANGSRQEGQPGSLSEEQLRDKAREQAHIVDLLLKAVEENEILLLRGGMGV